MLYDTHCHPYLAKEKSQKSILENFFGNKGEYINSVAVDISSSFSSLSLAKQYRGIYASIGIHPTSSINYIGRVQRTITTLESLYFQHKNDIIAIGECGLDYHWLEELSKKHNISEEKLIETQKEFFILQIRLAQKLGLPLIIHNRNSKDDIFEILKKENFKNFIFHCYSEDLDFAKNLIDFAPDCKLGFGGIVSFKNALSVQETVKNIPLENIIIETDSPYLTPVPYRGKEENEPSYIRYILDTIIDLRSESPDIIKKTIFENSVRIFKIKRS